jgi:hypothetical protein
VLRGNICKDLFINNFSEKSCQTEFVRYRTTILFADREIVTRFLGADAWDILQTLRDQCKTGLSTKMLFEVLGDMWVISRNPFIQDDLVESRKGWDSLFRLVARKERVFAFS